MASSRNDQRIHNGATAAFALLSVVPTGRASFGTDSGRRSVKWMPAVGVVGGVVVAATCAVTFGALQWLGVSDFAAAVLSGVGGAIVDFAFTRGMHWDGLADVGDAWWGGFNYERRLEIMSDPAVGTFGMFSVIAGFTLLLVGLAMSAGSVAWFIPAYALSRLAVVFSAQLGKPAKPNGLGSTVLAYGTDFAHGKRATITWLVALLTCISATAAVWFMTAPADPIPVLAAVAVSLLSAAAFPHLIALRMGGVTGDVIGASVLVTQVVAVLAFSIAL